MKHTVIENKEFARWLEEWFAGIHDGVKRTQPRIGRAGEEKTPDKQSLETGNVADGSETHDVAKK